MKKILTLAGSLVLAGAAFGQGRSVTFTALDAQSGDYSSGTTAVGGPVNLSAVTTVNVYSFLYITGNGFGSTSNVTGWGNSGNIASGVTNLDIYHNEVLTFSGSNFANPQMTGPVTATQKGDIDMSMDILITDGGGNPLQGPFNATPASNMNTSLPPVTPSDSGGHTIMTINRHLDVKPNNGPGVYVNTGTLTITRS